MRILIIVIKTAYINFCFYWNRNLKYISYLIFVFVSMQK